MPNTPRERSTRLNDEMIEDLLDAPIEELEEELREQGEDPSTIADRLRERLAGAQDEIIAAKMDAAKKALPILEKRPAPSMVKLPTPASRQPATTISSLTLAARNAERPFGFNDPSVDEDLRDLRSEAWDDD